jgi:hypothetical protein
MAAVATLVNSKHFGASTCSCFVGIPDNGVYTHWIALLVAYRYRYHPVEPELRLCKK